MDAFKIQTNRRQSLEHEKLPKHILQLNPKIGYYITHHTVHPANTARDASAVIKRESI